MTSNRRSGAAAILLLLFGVLAGGGEPERRERLAFTAFAPEAPPFYQVLVTRTQQVMKVAGMDVRQNQDQTFVILWTPRPRDEQGNYVVTQAIVGIKMDIEIGGNKISYDSAQAPDPANNNPMTAFFKAMLNHEFTVVINRDLEVKDVRGAEELVRNLSAVNPQLRPLLTNILSKDALRQMTEPTLFAVPPRPVRVGDTWNRTTHLDMGAIGGYHSRYTFTYQGRERGGDRIKQATQLVYTSPKETAGAALPFKIKSAKLSSTGGNGEAIFDRSKGRIASSDFSLDLDGQLVIEVGGMTTEVELKQKQTATMRSYDTNPLAGAK